MEQPHFNPVSPTKSTKSLLYRRWDEFHYVNDIPDADGTTSCGQLQREDTDGGIAKPIREWTLNAAAHPSPTQFLLLFTLSNIF